MTSSLHEAHYGTTLADRRIQCGLCPHRCVLAEGNRGRCGVRLNLGGTLRLEAYGHCLALAVDPVEKKPLYHFLPGSEVLSLGTAGCNLSCSFCQNSGLSRCHDGRSGTTPVSPEGLATLAHERDCASVAFTYNEPLIFLEYAVDMARACHERAVRTIAVTAGYAEDQPRRDFFAHMDAANIDLKAIRPDFYRTHCGATLQPVLDTIRYACRDTATWVELTTLLIPGENDSDDELRELGAWIASEVGVDVPLHLSAFHPAGRMRNHRAMDLKGLQRARGLVREEGLRHVYLGNVNCEDAGHTLCSSCHTPLVRRQGYRAVLDGLDLETGRCRRCGTPCPGVYR